MFLLLLSLVLVYRTRVTIKISEQESGFSNNHPFMLRINYSSLLIARKNYGFGHNA
jgi:hypothetical protein